MRNQNTLCTFASLTHFMMTQKRSLLLLLIYFASLLTSCKDSGSPESITRLFLISLNKLDYVTAKNISTRSTRELLNIMRANTDGKFTEAELELRAENLKVVLGKMEMINDSTAYVNFRTSPSILPLSKVKLVLVTQKLDKKEWQIDISTIDLAESQSLNPSGLDKAGDRESEDGQVHPDADSTAVAE